MKLHFSLLLTAIAMLGLTLPPVSYADPPSYAPAHGWRKKHDPYYVGYTGNKWPKDYGVMEGDQMQAWYDKGTVATILRSARYLGAW